MHTLWLNNLPFRNLPSGTNHKYVNKYMYWSVYYSLICSNRKHWRQPKCLICCSRVIHPDILLCLPCTLPLFMKMGRLLCHRGGVCRTAGSRSCHPRRSSLAFVFFFLENEFIFKWLSERGKVRQKEN